MKKTKWIVLVLAFALILSAAACGQNNGDEQKKGGGTAALENENGTGGVLSEAESALVDFYFGVIKDLYEEDHGLNDGVITMSLDLTNVTNLSSGGKTELAEKIAEEYGVEVNEATYAELVSAGAISDPDDFPSYENGLLFSFDSFELGNDGSSMKFSVNKWRTALGAYYFVDCEAELGDDGAWTYTVGGYAIS